eukprot:11154325-Lingulodinium_polyedra.AAC.1
MRGKASDSGPHPEEYDLWAACVRERAPPGEAFLVQIADEERAMWPFVGSCWTPPPRPACPRPANTRR